MLDNKNNFISLLYMRKSIKLISRSRGTRRTRRKRLSPPKRRNRSNRRQKLYRQQYQYGGADNEETRDVEEDTDEGSKGTKTDCKGEMESSNKEKAELEAHNTYLIAHVMSIYSVLARLAQIDLGGSGGNSGSNPNQINLQLKVEVTGKNMVVRQKKKKQRRSRSERRRRCNSKKEKRKQKALRHICVRRFTIY